MKNIVIIFFICCCTSVFAQKSASDNYAETITTHRATYLQSFLAQERGPLKKEDMAFVAFFEADEKYKVEASVRFTPDAVPFEMATYAGKVKPYIKYAELSFTIDGKDTKISVYQNLSFKNHPIYKDFLFIPFKDLTTGETSYGGGRYIDAKLSDIIDNKMIIDFNKCYNPYCAYADGYNCPIPPNENNLEVAINAGEKAFGKNKH